MVGAGIKSLTLVTRPFPTVFVITRPGDHILNQHNITTHKQIIFLPPRWDRCGVAAARMYHTRRPFPLKNVLRHHDRY